MVDLCDCQSDDTIEFCQPLIAHEGIHGLPLRAGSVGANAAMEFFLSWLKAERTASIYDRTSEGAAATTSMSGDIKSF